MAVRSLPACAGALTGYDPESGEITVAVGGEAMAFPKNEVALCRLRIEF